MDTSPRFFTGIILRAFSGHTKAVAYSKDLKPERAEPLQTYPPEG